LGLQISKFPTLSASGGERICARDDKGSPCRST
jgi:hypothetical protein